LLAVESEAVKELETVEGDTLAVEKLLDTWLCQSEFDLALVRVQQTSPSSMALAAWDFSLLVWAVAPVS
jgi:hypothetical protein